MKNIYEYDTLLPSGISIIYQNGERIYIHQAVDKLNELEHCVEKLQADCVTKSELINQIRLLMADAKRVDDAGFLSFIKLHEQIENLLVLEDK